MPFPSRRNQTSHVARRRSKVYEEVAEGEEILGVLVLHQSRPLLRHKIELRPPCTAASDGLNAAAASLSGLLLDVLKNRSMVLQGQNLVTNTS